MFQRNQVWVGLLAGTLLPLMGFVLFYEIFVLLEKWGAANKVGFSENFRLRTAAILGLALNAFLLNLYHKRRHEATVRGLVIVTSVLALAWLFVFGIKLMQ
ncbi:MAG: hypothetical protein J0L99_19290 [Chitinophagales bacterium]|nr:hypothetical protein [Chitinophagales bacterium]